MKQQSNLIAVGLCAVLLAVAPAGPLLAQLPDCTAMTAMDAGPPATEERDWVYFDLGCSSRVWAGYFAPDRWTVTDATGQTLPVTKQYFAATAGRAAEADGIIVKGARTQVQRWHIEVPAAGFLSFRLSSVPDFDLSAITFGINDRRESLGVQPDGTYFSPFLRPGDHFTITLPPGDPPVQWHRLLFHTNAGGVLVYPQATTIGTRYRPVASLPVHRITFPVDGYEKWPVFDFDGEVTTTDDRCELRANNPLFTVQYVDAPVLREDGYQLRRHFTIRQNCARGNVLEREVTWAPLPLIPTPSR